ncbi:uncharacterized protein [Panulirus ornatus]|uniref:uncharacterized protein n=1 Tax=Panulirus ornatus TaxID=150431 RepID=UPI003A8A3653
MESLKEKDWKRQQRESSAQRTNMFLTLQDLQCIFYILAWAASVAAKKQMNLEALKEKDWKIEQQKSSGQRTNMFLNLQDLQSIFYILVWAACVAGNNQALLEVLRGLYRPQKIDKRRIMTISLDYL